MIKSEVPTLLDSTQNTFSAVYFNKLIPALKSFPMAYGIRIKCSIHSYLAKNPKKTINKRVDITNYQ